MLSELSPVPHCPHCLLPIADGSVWPYPRQASRCPHCLLIIGAGRARDGGAQEGDARSRGSAAGVLANAARREQGEVQDTEVVSAALRAVAAQVGCPVERLRMLDYQQAAELDDELPGLANVLATFSTWKGARATAAEPAGEDDPVVLNDAVVVAEPAADDEDDLRVAS